MNTNKLLTLLGFANKATQLSAGTEAVKNSLKKKKGFLLLIANDISIKNQKKWFQKASEYNMPAYLALDKQSMGHAIGQSARAVILINDEKMAEAMIHELNH